MADQTITQADWDAVAQERDDPVSTPPAQNALPADATGSAPAAEETKVDPYEDLHPEVRAKLQQFDQLSATVPSLINELREAKGRIGSLQSQWAKLEQRAAEQPTQAQVAAAAKDPEKWASLKNDYPEWGEGITEYVEARLGQIAGSGLSADQVEQLVAQRAGERTSQLEQTFNERLVALRHKDWKNEVKTAEFNAWFSTQDAATQALANSADPLDAIAMLDRYAEHKAKPVQQVQQDRQQRLKQAVTTTKPGQAAVTKTFEEMSPQEQWEYLAAQREK